MSKAFAVLGLFDSATALMKAIPKVKALKLGRLETYTPYPIHGMDEALELRRSPLGGMVLVMGVIGALTALGFQYWISAGASNIGSAQWITPSSRAARRPGPGKLSFPSCSK